MDLNDSMDLTEQNKTYLYLCIYNIYVIIYALYTPINYYTTQLILESVV